MSGKRASANTEPGVKANHVVSQPPVPTIVIADDHNLVRKGIRLLIETELDLKVIADTGSGKEAVEIVGRLKPDILVTDLMMPDLNGIEVIKQVRTLSPKTICLVLSMYDNDAYIFQALEEGAAGYVLKEASADDLVQAIRAAVSGKRFLSAPLSEQRLEAFRKSIQPNWKAEE